jgi:hypothetical protein
VTDIAVNVRRWTECESPRLCVGVEININANIPRSSQARNRFVLFLLRHGRSSNGKRAAIGSIAHTHTHTHTHTLVYAYIYSRRRYVLDVYVYTYTHMCVCEMKDGDRMKTCVQLISSVYLRMRRVYAQVFALVHISPPVARDRPTILPRTNGYATSQSLTFAEESVLR